MTQEQGPAGVRTALVAVLLAAPVLLAGCASNSAPDADGDGLPDAFETNPRDIAYLQGDETRIVSVTSDPEKTDTDGDGISDFDEARLGTNPSDVDTDADGLVDGKSVRLDAGLIRAKNLVADPNDPGLALGEGSICPDLSPTDDNSDKPYADGLADGEEVRGWEIVVRGETQRVTSDPCSPDTDNDGLEDTKEKAAGSDPRSADTDGDGVKDGLDADPTANVVVSLTLEKIRLKVDKDLPAGANLRFVVSAGPTQRTFSKDVPGKGEHTLGFPLDLDVDDTFTGETEEGAREHDIPVSVVVYDEDPGTREPVAVSGSSSEALIVWSAHDGTWSVQERTGSGSGTAEGNDAVLSFRLETRRT